MKVRDPGARPRSALALCVTALIAIAALASAQPLDPAFSRSRIEPMPDAVTAGEAFDLAFVVVNDGATTTYTRVTFDLPDDVLLADGVRGCDAQFERDSRDVVLEGSFERGVEHRCALSLVALPRRSTQASLSLRIFTPPDAYAGDVKVVAIDTPPAPAAVRVGGVGISAVGLGVLGWLSLTALAVLGSTLAGGRDRRGAAFAACVALGFLAYFAFMAWDDYRVLTAFRETRCEVMDAAVSVDSRRGSGAGRHDVVTFAPHFAVRYAGEQGPVAAVGFSTASRLRYTREDVVAVVDAMTSGGTAPCWYDPGDPRRVVLLRGFGGAYVFALIPAALIAVLAAFGWRR